MARALACALALVLAGGALIAGCTRSSGEERDAPAAGGSPVPERVPAPSGARLGAHPGHLRGAFAYASVEPRALHALLLELPLAPELRRELARRGRELGVEPFSPELLDALQVRPGATLSMSARLVDTLDVHLRVHLPVEDLGPARALAASIAARQPERSERSQTCEQAAPHLLCAGAGAGVFVLRERSGALQLDLVHRLSPEAREQPAQRPTLLAALRADTDTPELVAGLRGQLGLLIDGPATVELLRASALAEASASGREGLEQRQLERGEVLARLHASERVFEGLALEGELGASSLVLRARWLPTPGAEARMPELFALSEIDADVPSLDALCEGALICARSRGVPRRERFASLASGIYSRPDQLGSALERFERDAALILALETWPNLIASSNMLPGTYLGTGEAMMLSNAFGLVSRVLGFGLSIRSLDGRGGEYLAYARTSSVDLDSLVGMLELAELRPARTQLEGVPSRQLRVAALSGRELEGNFYALDDPDEGAGAWGWALVADDDERVRWLSALEHDEGAAPLLYAEVGDLGRLAASLGQLGFARGWLERRWLRAQLQLGPGSVPELRAAMGTRG